MSGHYKKGRISVVPAIMVKESCNNVKSGNPKSSPFSGQESSFVT